MRVAQRQVLQSTVVGGLESRQVLSEGDLALGQLQFHHPIRIPDP